MLWRLHNVAKAYNQRPSDLLGVIDDEYTAFCLDEATWLWGSHVEGQLSEATRPQPSGKDAAKRVTEEKQMKAAVEAAFRKMGITKDDGSENKAAPPSSGTPFVDRG